jgi:hypothetical protein
MRYTMVSVRAVKCYRGAATKQVVKIDFEVKFCIGRDVITEIRSEFLGDGSEDECMTRAMLWAAERKGKAGITNEDNKNE